VLFRECVLSRLQNGKPKLILGAGQDITHQRLAEEQARQGKVALDEIVDLAPIGLALVGLDGKWIRVNKALCQLVGYSKEELLLLDFQSITHPDDLKADIEQRAQMLRGELQTYSIEKRYVKKRGSEVWCKLTVAAVRDEKGRPSQFIAQMQDISEHKQLEERMLERQRILESQSTELAHGLRSLEHDTRTDALTNVFNRRWFDDRLEASLRMGDQFGHEFALIMLDIDHFKAFNDEFGHDVGDDVLRAVGQVLRDCTREHDIAARYGGEEFAIICIGASIERALDVAERVREGLRQIHSFPREITASFGVSALSDTLSTAQDIVRAADQGLYQAKELGRDRICVGPGCERLSA
jgi:diguanylate cyclase (GGDEF)-like protein/PAS domain S-box-containing protein